MDLFEHRYYKFNKTLMRSLGMWPEQYMYIRYLISFVLLSIETTIAAPLLIAIVKNPSKWNIVIEACMLLFFGFFCAIKLTVFSVYSDKMLKLLNHIRADWKAYSNDCDAHILHEYAEKGRKVTIAYAVICYATCILGIFQPVVPKIIDSILKNGTEPGAFPGPHDYGYIDMQKYYFYIILHMYVCASLAFIIAIIFDCWFMVLVQHGCGLFAVLGRKLQRIGDNKRSVRSRRTTHATDIPDVDLVYLRSCINRHHEAIKYADLVETCYTWCFLVLMGINILLISMTGLQVFMSANNLQQNGRFMFLNCLSMAHLYIENYMGQILMDHSISIRHYIFNGEWYKLPQKSQKLLLLILMRCNVPCKLTAGKISILCVETFTMCMKTSLSYFTILRTL